MVASERNRMFLGDEKGSLLNLMFVLCLAELGLYVSVKAIR